MKTESANGSHAAMPNTTGTCSSEPRQNGKIGPRLNGLTSSGWQIDNLRSALDWAFSSHGDKVLAVALTTAGLPLWMNLSLLKECRTRVEQALAILMAAAIEDPRREMKLCNAFGVSLSYTGGAVSEIEMIWAAGNASPRPEPWRSRIPIMRTLRFVVAERARGSCAGPTICDRCRDASRSARGRADDR